MTIRSNKKTQSEISLQDPIGVDKEGNSLTLIDVLGTDPDEVVDEVYLKIETKNLYDKMTVILNKREKEIIELRYGLSNGICKTQREIAKMFGISRSYVSRIEKKAIEKLSKVMNKD